MSWQPVVLASRLGGWQRRAHAHASASARLRLARYSIERAGPPARPTVAQRIKEGALHYWHGSKLLAYETQISARLVLKLLRGERLIRREYRQLLRTTGDLFRLLPFVVILIIPFLEFALPLLLKFFPNMLPSTFEDRLQAEERVKKQLKVKLEMAKFLQDMAASMAASRAESRLPDLQRLFQRARTSGEALTSAEIVQVCRHLGEEVTLENLARPQLVSLSRYMSLNVFGTDSFLRYQIRKAIGRLKRDDEMILQEGVASLTDQELSAACHARGIRTLQVTQEYMRRELQQWVEMQVLHAVPAPLLILSRALALSENIHMEDALRATVTSLPEPVLNEASVGPEAPGPAAAPAAQKIQLIREQELLISEELQQEQSAGADGGGGVPADAPPPVLSPAQIGSITEAVLTLATREPARQEREGLAELVEEKDGLHKGSVAGPADETARLVEGQVERLIKEIDEQIGQFEGEIGKRLQVISPDKDGSISAEQLQAIMQMVRNSPKEAGKIAQAIRSFDSDGDGKIFIKDILRVAQEAGSQEGHGVVRGRERQGA